MTFCCHFRDESASATYFCKKKADSEPEEDQTSGVEKEWIYYRKLRAGEEERCLRHKQVQPGAVLSTEQCWQAFPLATSAVCCRGSVDTQKTSCRWEHQQRLSSI